MSVWLRPDTGWRQVLTNFCQMMLDPSEAASDFATDEIPWISLDSLRQEQPWVVLRFPLREGAPFQGVRCNVVAAFGRVGPCLRPGVRDCQCNDDRQGDAGGVRGENCHGRNAPHADAPQQTPQGHRADSGPSEPSHEWEGIRRPADSSGDPSHRCRLVHCIDHPGWITMSSRKRPLSVPRLPPPGLPPGSPPR